MSTAKGNVLSVLHLGLSKAEVASKYDLSWQWVHTLVQDYFHPVWVVSTQTRSYSKSHDDYYW